MHRRDLYPTALTVQCCTLFFLPTDRNTSRAALRLLRGVFHRFSCSVLVSRLCVCVCVCVTPAGLPL